MEMDSKIFNLFLLSENQKMNDIDASILLSLFQWFKIFPDQNIWPI